MQRGQHRGVHPADGEFLASEPREHGERARVASLAEAQGEAIKYRIETAYDEGPTGRVALAGPTCDSTDVIYECTHYELPLALTAGDRIRLLSTGAYTTTYASVAFNGFAPLRGYYLPAEGDS